jgi:abelson tyrosine-protein kinase 1
MVELIDIRNRQSVSRRYSFQLRDGHKAAFMCTETTKYRYVESLDAPKKWFKANVDSIMKVYGRRHHIQKEDLFLGKLVLSFQEYQLSSRIILSDRYA